MFPDLMLQQIESGLKGLLTIPDAAGFREPATERISMVFLLLVEFEVGLGVEVVIAI